MWICPSLRSRNPIIQKNSALGLPLIQEWVPQNLRWFLYGFTPHSGVGEDSVLDPAHAQEWESHNSGEFWCGFPPCIGSQNL